MVGPDNEKRSASLAAGPRERLLDVADELFSEHGFEATSIRQLAVAAGCNLASVNYYFGSKDQLYVEVWRRHLVQMRDLRMASIRQAMSEGSGKPSLEDLLRAFAKPFIGPLTDEHKSRRLRKLMAREMLDQHLPPNMFVEEIIRPTMGIMQEALVGACPGLEASRVPLIIFSIAAQLVHAIHVRAMFARTDSSEMPGLDLTESVDHIVKFSAAGIRAYAEGKMR